MRKMTEDEILDMVAENQMEDEWETAKCDRCGQIWSEHDGDGECPKRFNDYEPDFDALREGK